MEEHIYGLLSAGLDFDVKWGRFGDEASLPRAHLHNVSGVRDMVMAGKRSIQGRIQIDCYGATYLAALTASRQVRAILEGYRGGPVQGMFLQAIRDGEESDTVILDRVSLTFSVTYRD